MKERGAQFGKERSGGPRGLHRIRGEIGGDDGVLVAACRTASSAGGVCFTSSTGFRASRRMRCAVVPSKGVSTKVLAVSAHDDEVGIERFAARGDLGERLAFGDERIRSDAGLRLDLLNQRIEILVDGLRSSASSGPIAARTSFHAAEPNESGMTCSNSSFAPWDRAMSAARRTAANAGRERSVAAEDRLNRRHHCHPLFGTGLLSLFRNLTGESRAGEGTPREPGAMSGLRPTVEAP